MTDTAGFVHRKRLNNQRLLGSRRTGSYPQAEMMFRQSPQAWKNDVSFFRLELVCEYLDTEQGIRYKDCHVNLQSVRYTNPSDLFLNGVIDTREGTYGNLAVLHVAIGRRLGWPVHLTCAGSHFICRNDDGQVVHNIETTRTGDQLLDAHAAGDANLYRYCGNSPTNYTGPSGHVANLVAGAVGAGIAVADGLGLGTVGTTPSSHR